MNQPSASHTIVLFDGVCNLCNSFVQFVIRRDPDGIFKFGALQSEKGEELLRKYPTSLPGLTTIVLIHNGIALTESDAVLHILKNLGGIWKTVLILRNVPRFLRDGVYRLVSRYRYRIFGQRESCMVPTPDLVDRFI